MNPEPRGVEGRPLDTADLRTGLFSGGGERTSRFEAALTAAGKKFMCGGGGENERATLIPHMAGFTGDGFRYSGEVATK